MVTYLTDRIDLEQIKTAISNLGYDADDVPANEEAYRKLPGPAKPEDGGGHPKPRTQPETPPSNLEMQCETEIERIHLPD